MGTRCKVTSNLDVYHKHPDGGNGIDNAEVLCQECHKLTFERQPSYGVRRKNPDPFDQETKDEALKNAGNQCEFEYQIKMNVTIPPFSFPV